MQPQKTAQGSDPGARGGGGAPVLSTSPVFLMSSPACYHCSLHLASDWSGSLASTTPRSTPPPATRLWYRRDVREGLWVGDRGWLREVQALGHFREAAFAVPQKFTIGAEFGGPVTPETRTQSRGLRGPEQVEKHRGDVPPVFFVFVVRQSAGVAERALRAEADEAALRVAAHLIKPRAARQNDLELDEGDSHGAHTKVRMVSMSSAEETSGKNNTSQTRVRIRGVDRMFLYHSTPLALAPCLYT